MTKTKNIPLVGILMGSDSDLATMRQAVDICDEFGVSYELRVISAHRTPAAAVRYAKAALGRGLRVIVAGAGGSAHLPGIVSAFCPLPVIGVPIETRALKGLDSLLSIVQMPPNVPVATVGIGSARNAGLLAVRILAMTDSKLMKKVIVFKRKVASESKARDRRVRKGESLRVSAVNL